VWGRDVTCEALELQEALQELVSKGVMPLPAATVCMRERERECVCACHESVCVRMSCSLVSSWYVCVRVCMCACV